MKVSIFFSDFPKVQYISRVRTTKGYYKAYVIEVFIPKIKERTFEQKF